MRPLLALAALCCAAPAFAQNGSYGSIGTFSLTNPEYRVSASDAATAGAGSFTPGAEPLAFHRNPALLASVARSGRLLVGADYSGGVGALERIGFDGVALTNVALAAGTTVRLAGQPLALGGAISRREFSFGDQTYTDEFGNVLGEILQAESLWSAGGAVGWSGPVEVDLGATVHARKGFDIIQRFSPLEIANARGATLDVGAMLTLPVFGRTARGAVSPVLDLSTGYVQRHLTLSTTRPEPYLPLDGTPSTARRSTLGYGAIAGLDLAIGPGHVRAIELDGRIESDAALDRFVGFCAGDELPCDPPELVRSPFVGDVSVGDVLLGDRGPSTVGRRAIRLTLLDAVSYTRGHAESGRNGMWTSTWGASLDLGGALRFAGLASGDRRLAQVGSALTLRADYAATDEGPGRSRSSYGGLTLGWEL